MAYTNPMKVANGLALDFVVETAGGSDVFLMKASDGSITQTSSVPASRVSSGGNLTEATSSVLTIVGGSAVLLGNASIQVKEASTSQSGYLSSTDWNTFNSKMSSTLADSQLFVGSSGGVATARSITGDVTINNTGVTAIGAGVIVNADIHATAAIAVNKLAAMSVSLAVATDSSGFVTTVAGVTPTKLGYLTNVSSDIQAQFTVTNQRIVGIQTSAILQAPGAGQNNWSIVWDNTNSQWTLSASGGGGTVTGPGSSLDNAITRWDGTGGDAIQSSGIIIDDANNVTGVASITVGTSGLFLFDTNASHTLNVIVGSDLTDNRNLTFTTGDANRNITLSGDPTLSDWFDQSVKTTSDTLFNSATLSNAGGLHIFDSDSSHDLIFTTSSNLSADRTLTINTGDSDRTVTINTSGTFYITGGTDVALADGGTGASLSDPNYDAIFVWDNTAGLSRLAEIGSGLSYDTYTNILTGTGGGIGGSTGSNDNRLLRADGTGGATIQASPFELNDSGDILSTTSNITVQSVFGYALLAGKDGTFIGAYATANAGGVWLQGNVSFDVAQVTPVGDIFLLGGETAGTSTLKAGDVYIQGGINGGASGNDGNVAIGTQSVSDWQDMENGLFVADATTNPTGNPTGGGFLYSDAGDGNKLKWRVPGGTTYDLTSGGGGVSDGTYGDITVSGGATVWTVNLNINKAWSGTHSFTNNNFRLFNPANTSSYNFVTSAIAANRDVTLPLLAAADVFVFEAFAQTLTNKTINGSSNTITNVSLTTAVTGVLPVANGGTSFSSYTTGDLIQASAAGTLAKLNSVATGNVLISGGVATVSSWGKVTSSHVDATVQAAGLSWLLTGTSTFTGAVTIAGSGSNTLKHTFNGLGVTQVNGAGQWLANETAAALGAQQISPSVVWEGRGWETTGGTSQSVKYVAEVLPVQGTTASGLWRLRYSFNGGANTTVASIDSGSTTFSNSSGSYFTSSFIGTTTFSVAGGSTVMALNGAGLPHVRIGANNNGFVVVSNDGVSSSLTGTGFGMSYRGIGGTAGAGTNAIHAMLFSGSSINLWAGIYRQIWVSQLSGSTIAPSTGTGGWIGLSLENTFNITSTAIATLKGVHYNPTMTSTTSNTTHAAWEHTSGYVQWNSTLSPAQITANQDDYNPTGLNNGGSPHGASIMRVNSDASRDITSIVGGVAGRLMIVANVGAQNVVLKDDDGATGTAANRIQLNADVTILPEESVLLWYDGVSSRWRTLK